LSQAIPGPVAPKSRIVEIDMVRGFALFGVLLVNMYNFGAYSIAWSSPADQLAFAVMRFFFEAKSWTLFSILFGFGFALQLLSAETRGVSILPFYLRRMAALFAFGAVHALFYDGDILMLYAELGLGLLLVRRLPTRGLLLLALGLLLVFPVTRLVSSQVAPAEEEEVQTVAEARAELEEDQRTHVYAIGSWAEVAADNASAIPADPLEDVATPESGLAVFALFLLGFALGRSGVLRDIPAHVVSIGRVRNWGLGLGLAAMAGERVLAATAGYAVFRPDSRREGGPRPPGLRRPPGPHRLPDPDPDVHHVVLRVRVWPGLPAGAGRRHRRDTGVLRRSGRRVSVVDETLPLRSRGVALARPDLPQVAAHAPHERRDDPRRGVAGAGWRRGTTRARCALAAPGGARGLSRGCPRSPLKKVGDERLQGKAEVSSTRFRS